MNALYVILYAFPILVLGATAFLVMVVVGVRKGDRGDLTAHPRNRLDAITRRVVGLGVRNENTDNK